MRSAMPAASQPASQLPGGEPTYVDDALAPALNANDDDGI